MKIKLSEFRKLVKSILKEETPASAINKYPTPVTKKFVTASGWSGEFRVTQEYLASNGTIVIKTVNGVPFYFYCKNAKFLMEYDNRKVEVSNLEYTKELQSRFCANINKIYPKDGES